METNERTSGELLMSIVEHVKPRLLQTVEESARFKPSPKKWSRKEILGHLIDSATNNHRRFIVAAQKDNLVFDGYLQEEWVTLQDYQNRDWLWMVEFWSDSNEHLAFAMDRIPEDKRMQECASHSLHRMAWKPIPEDVPTNLDYLIKDYIGHLEHHVRQMLPDYRPIVMGTYEYAASK